MEQRNHPQRRKGKAAVSAITAEYGMLLALALLLSYVETLIPISLGVPGVKLGLANLVSIVALYSIGVKGTIIISLNRILLVGLTFGNLFSTFYGLGGGALSLLFMTAAKKRAWFGPTGVSIIGGVGHNIGQLAVAALVVENAYVFYYLPFLLAAGSVAGAVIGLLGGIIIKRIASIVKRR